MKNLAKRSSLLILVISIMVVGSSAHAGRMRSPGASRPDGSSPDFDQYVPNPQRELRHLSKELKLGRNQRSAVGYILEERTREIRLILDIGPVSHEYAESLAAVVIEDSNAQIESVLKRKQKKKFDRELARKGPLYAYPPRLVLVREFGRGKQQRTAMEKTSLKDLLRLRGIKPASRAA